MRRAPREVGFRLQRGIVRGPRLIGFAAFAQNRAQIVGFAVRHGMVEPPRSYELQANCDISKPVDLEQFMTVMKSIENFWLTIVTLPHQT